MIRPVCVAIVDACRWRPYRPVRTQSRCHSRRADSMRWPIRGAAVALALLALGLASCDRDGETSSLSTIDGAASVGGSDLKEPPIDLSSGGELVAASERLFVVATEGQRGWWADSVATFGTRDGKWVKLADPPHLQQFAASAVGESLIVVGVVCSDPPPCDSGKRGVATSRPPYNSWSLRTDGDVESTESFSIARLGSDAEQAFFLVGRELWMVSADGSHRSQMVPVPHWGACLSNGRVLVAAPADPDKERSPEEVGSPTVDDIAVVRLEDRQWVRIAEPPRESSLVKGALAVPTCVADGLALVGEDGQSMFIRESDPRWVPTAGSAPHLPFAGAVKGFAGEFVISDGQLHSFHDGTWRTPPSDVDWRNVSDSAEFDGRLVFLHPGPNGEGLLDVMEAPSVGEGR